MSFITQMDTDSPHNTTKVCTTEKAVVPFTPFIDGVYPCTPVISTEWQTYINDLRSSDNISKAAIYTQKGQLLATSHRDFTLSHQELEGLLRGYRAPQTVYKEGMWVNGARYTVHLADGHFGMMGKTGFPVTWCSVCKTKQLLIVAVHTQNGDARKCNETVMDMGDFFVEKGV